MKRSEIFFSSIQVPVDFSMILLAAATAYFLRGSSIFHGYVSPVFNLRFQDYLNFALMVAPLFILILAIEGMYRMRVTRRPLQEAYGVMKSITFGLIILIIAVFLNREWFSSRFVIIMGWLLAIFYVVLARLIIQRVQKWLLVHKNIGMHRVLLIGFNDKMRNMRSLLIKDKSLGYRVVDQIADASITHIKEIREWKGIDEIIIGDPSMTDDEQAKLFDYCQINNILYRYFPTSLQTTRFTLQIWHGEPIIEFQHTPLDGWGRVLKRTYDIIAGFILTVLFSPFMLVVALLIKLEDPEGPIIYKNERIGENGKKFFVYKFRYMLWKYCITPENKHLEEAMEYEKNLILERNTREGGIL